jgi:hypothetical protein
MIVALFPHVNKLSTLKFAQVTHFAVGHILLIFIEWREIGFLSKRTFFYPRRKWILPPRANLNKASVVPRSPKHIIFIIFLIECILSSVHTHMDIGERSPLFGIPYDYCSGHKQYSMHFRFQWNDDNFSDWKTTFTYMVSEYLKLKPEVHIRRQSRSRMARRVTWLHVFRLMAYVGPTWNKSWSNEGGFSIRKSSSVHFKSKM